MRPTALLALLILASGCEPVQTEPPTITLSAGNLRDSGRTAAITAVIRYRDGWPYRGEVEFTTSRGTLSSTTVEADSTGTAVTDVTVMTFGEVTVSARAGGATNALIVDLQSFFRPAEPNSTLLRFRVSPASTQAGSQLRPAPEVIVESYSPLSGITHHATTAQVPITITLTDCTATLDQRSQLSHTSIGGLATFDNIAFTTPATGCKLTATSPGTGVRSASSTSFDLLP
jgi:hypothetical protein